MPLKCWVCKELDGCIAECEEQIEQSRRLAEEWQNERDRTREREIEGRSGDAGQARKGTRKRGRRNEKASERGKRHAKGDTGKLGQEKRDKHN